MVIGTMYRKYIYNFLLCMYAQENMSFM